MKTSTYTDSRTPTHLSSKSVFVKSVMTLKGKVRQKQTEIIANMEDVNISSAAALYISTATG